MSVNRIVGETRSGRQLISNAGSKKLKAIKPFTTFRRKYFERFNSTYPSYRNKLSSLTFTGEFLNALTYSVKRVGSKLSIGLGMKSGEHKPYRFGDLKSGRQRIQAQISELMNTKTYEQIKNEQYKMGRPFIQLDKKGVKMLTNEILRNIRRLLGSKPRR